MGANSRTRAEKRVDDKWQVIEGLQPFEEQNYALYGWLANVRNSTALQPLDSPRGIPWGPFASRSDEDPLADYSCCTWFSIDELAVFDYDATVEDRRMTVKSKDSWRGDVTCEVGAGEMTTYRELFGCQFFADMQALQDAGAERVVICFSL